ncbi:hypothetical protein LEP1GSC188_2048 [Leptospira weilii serovar Topaz str. LT2116]|uniref:Uncharacterized protein n=1 Tax=Leptospira weilii serovar Topaz str. LT2116 TaxID=1088540 RepID=M3H3T1_9LEPT|nr:hypothetical protein LEP1GSC188_2048 [Leptospira weilii serovar Topaz str. LT2116]
MEPNGHLPHWLEKTPIPKMRKYYDIKNKIAWDWASMDSAMV